MGWAFDQQFKLLGLIVGIGVGCGEVAVAQSPSPQAKKFSELLVEYKNHPQFYKDLQGGAKTYDDLPLDAVGKIPASAMNARFNDFLPRYDRFKKFAADYKAQLDNLLKRQAQTPLSQLKERSEIDVRVLALQSKLVEANRLLFLHSVDANESFKEALKLVPSLKSETAVAIQKPRPTLPGVFGGSWNDRLKTLDSDKINLTPVDPEFYATQLGQKIESDLGGKAEAWAYDYASDRLFVQVGEAQGMLRVLEDSGGVRFIQTRTGAKFNEPQGSDARVDSGSAKGRFLTGNPNEESLFGAFPKSSPRVTNESQQGHSQEKTVPHNNSGR